MPFIDRDKLPDDLQGDYDEVEKLSNEFMAHMHCQLNHEIEMKTIREKMKPLIEVILEHVLGDGRDLSVFDEFMRKLHENDDDE